MTAAEIRLAVQFLADRLLGRERSVLVNSQPPAGPCPETELPGRLAACLAEIRQAGRAGIPAPGSGRGEHPLLVELRECAACLRRVDPGRLGDEPQRRALWINLYNALVFQGVLELQVAGSILDSWGFLWRICYGIGGQRFSAHDIEHGILRGDRHFLGFGKHFGAGDPRREQVLLLDPRIHFALHCAARSCPPIASYTGEELDRQLDQATRAFLAGGGAEVDREQGEVRLSRIFKWYERDFGDVREFVARHLPEEEADFVRRERPRLRHQPYDWSLTVGDGAADGLN